MVRLKCELKYDERGKSTQIKYLGKDTLPKLLQNSIRI